jgi:hypothetical protein
MRRPSALSGPPPVELLWPELDVAERALAPVVVSCAVVEASIGAGAGAGAAVAPCVAFARPALALRARARPVAAVLWLPPAPADDEPLGVPVAAVVAVVDVRPESVADERDVETPGDFDEGEGVVGVPGVLSVGTVGVVTGGTAGAVGVDGVCTVATPGTSTFGVGELSTVSGPACTVTAGRDGVGSFGVVTAGGAGTVTAGRAGTASDGSFSPPSSASAPALVQSRRMQLSDTTIASPLRRCFGGGLMLIP